MQNFIYEYYMVYIYDSLQKFKNFGVFSTQLCQDMNIVILFLVYRIATTTKIYHVHKMINFIKKIKTTFTMKMTLPRLYKKYCIDNRVYYLFDIFRSLFHKFVL